LHFPDAGLRARLSAIALKCAKGLHRDSEEGWFDALREADFIKFQLTDRSRQHQPDGSMIDSESGSLNDVVKHSITLCHVLEAGGLNKPRRSVNKADQVQGARPKTHSEASVILPKGNPFPDDHRSYQLWNRLTPELRQAVSRLSLEHRAETLELDTIFQEKLAETGSLDLVERYFLARFDLFASQLLSVASPATTHGEAHYERYLNEFYEMERAQLRRLLPEMRSDVREEIISRISLKLSGRRSHWLREEISWRLQGCTPRPHLKVRWHLDADTNASETTSSIDAFMRRYSDQLERNRAAGASNGEMSNAPTAAPTQPPDSSLGGRIAAGEIGNGGGADKLKDTVRQAFWKDRQAVFSDEGGVFDMLAGRYSKGVPNLDLWLKGHSVSLVRVDRQDRSRPPIIIDRPHLTVGISPQPDVLESLRDKPGFRGRGLLARFLYGLPQSRLGYRTLAPYSIPPQVENRYKLGIKQLIDWHPAEVLRLRFSDEAYREWKNFQRSLEPQFRDGGALQSLRDWGGKLAGAVARLAGIFHLVLHTGSSELETEVAPATVRSAIDLGKSLISHAQAVFALMDRDPGVSNAEKLVAWIVHHEKTSFTVRECFRAHQGCFQRVDALQAILVLLEQHGYIRRAKQGSGGGRPASDLCEVNPAALNRGIDELDR
jgi:hypothetical protein